MNTRKIYTQKKKERKKNAHKNNSLLKKLYVVHRARRQIWL